ncbi:hypothetical protein [Clostridium hydrogeniformans]|uniref:hypothetical protein n=1 Tax=Clostridium hydrogeniformans TaxID=349933 RepID=UPI0004844CEE|nr:hypothetical protein [Clostridium hydrogeniformans]
MTSSEIKDMKFETIETLKEYLDALIQDVNTVSEFFREDNISEGLKYTANIAEALQIVCEAVGGVNDILKEKVDLSGINNLAQEMVESLENEDYVLLGDLLEYEIIPMLEEIKEKVYDTL